MSIRSTSRLVQNGVSASPSIGGVAGRVPVFSTTPFDASYVSPPTSTTPGPVSRAVAAHEADAGVLEPLHRDRVVPVVGGLVADAGVHRSPVGAHVGRAGQPVDPTALGQRVGRADDHLAGDAAEVGALPTHQPLVHPDHREPGLGQLRRRRLATRAETDHHHVA